MKRILLITTLLLFALSQLTWAAVGSASASSKDKRPPKIASRAEDSSVPQAGPADKDQAAKEESRTNPAAQSFEVIVTAPRVEIPLKDDPAATTVVETPVLQMMPRTIAIDEVMKLVPGVRVDNQADGERVHLSIRGQGILTERGTRGIRTIVDGIPLNDPSGFVSDFYDVDWANVRRVEVLRGPAAAFYGSGSSGGIINILTRDGGSAPVEAGGFLTGGSYGFYKGLAEVGGTSGAWNYSLAGSYTHGDGYRQHTNFWGDNIYGKFHVTASSRVRITGIFGRTDYYNGNAEGLNLAWFSADPDELRKIANPDSITYDEYQRTGRFTGGLIGSVELTDNLNFAISTFYRATKYTESVPSSVIHRDYDTPGVSLQVNHDAGQGWLRNHLSFGADLSWQMIDELRHPNLGLAVEGPETLSDQTMNQSGSGLFVIDRVELGQHWGAILSLRYDDVTVKLDDHIGTLSGRASYQRVTGRAGVTWNPLPDLGFYASWGTGFLPPGTEELANNPNAFGGFNEDLKPATSAGEEVGVRGLLGGRFTYDLALFTLSTENDFGRFRVASRPLETFYGNVGSTDRYGLEASLAWYPVQPLALRLAYTYNHFKYDTVQTLDAANSVKTGTWLPNSPQHQLYIDGQYFFTPRLSAGLSLDYVSSWYVDSTNRVYEFAPILFPGVLYGRTDPYALVHVRLSYRFGLGGVPLELQVFGHNIFGVEYYGFTEPDPDGNSYQPAATAEWSVSLRVGLGLTD
jgi:iron complex outermembrane receptor protein